MPSVAKQLAEVEAGLRPPVLKVGDLNVKRDFTDVRDVVAAYRELLDKAEPGEIYNVCSGRAVLLADLVRQLQEHCSATVKIEVDPARVRFREAPQMLGDPGKLQRATGWSAKIPLESTLQALLAYWRTKVTRDFEEANDTAVRMPRE
jgi:GDP-4-dehydro-6-deoxy-D-mannose reductase